MEKPLLDLQVQKPVALKNLLDNAVADTQDSSILGIRGSKPIVHFGGTTVKKLSPPDIHSGSSSAAFSSVGKQPQHPARRDRDKGDVVYTNAGGDSGSVNTTEDGSSTASHMITGASNTIGSMAVAPTIPKVNFDDLCLQHVVGGGGFGQVSTSPVSILLLRIYVCDILLWPRCGRARGWAPLWRLR